jgi:hypothetical protein
MPKAGTTYLLSRKGEFSFAGNHFSDAQTLAILHGQLKIDEIPERALKRFRRCSQHGPLMIFVRRRNFFE